jgi:cytoskeleton protein RodZ
VGTGVGRALSEARQAQGLTVADVAQQLKFMPRQIEALEAERFSSLPGPTIARGMVRSYARLLKLEPEPLLKMMEGQLPAPESGPQLGVRRGDPVSPGDSGRRSTILYLVLSAAVLAIAVAAVYEWRHEQPVPAFVAASDGPAPASPTPVEEKPSAKPAHPALASAAPAAPVENQAAVKAARTEKAEKAEKPEKVEKQEKAEKLDKPAASAPAPAAEAKPAPKPRPESVVAAPQAAAGGANRLVLRFEEEAWVEVIDAQGRHLISSLNPAGTERSVRARPPLSLVIGNAQHVRVTYNDREIDLKPHTRVEVARFTIQ